MIVEDESTETFYVAYIINPADPDKNTSGADVRHILVQAETTKEDSKGNTVDLPQDEIDKNFESLEDLSVLADTITEDELFNLPLEQNLARLFAHEEVKVFGQNEVLYKCICSKERCLNALSEIPSSELLDMANCNEGTSMTCQHCNKTYTFTKEELLNLVHQKNQ